MATATHRRLSRRALLAAGAAGLIAACGGGESTPPTPTTAPKSRLLVTPTPIRPRELPSPTPVGPPTPAKVTYVWQDIVSQSDRKLVADVVPVIQEYFFKTGEHYVRAPILIQNVSGKAAVADSERIGRNGAIEIDTEGSWGRLDETGKKHVVAHEWFHQVQFDFRVTTNREAFWIVEGAAEYAAYSFVVSNGGLTWPAARGRALAQARQGRVLPPTGEFHRELIAENRNLYPVMFLAVENLLTGADVTTLINFYKLLPQKPWAEAFHVTFGKDIFTYEAEFDALRRRQGI
jgi:hypothetical protein